MIVGVPADYSSWSASVYRSCRGGRVLGLLTAAGDYIRTPCRKPESLAVALNWGIGSSSLNAEVKAFDRLQRVRGSNSG